MRMLRNFLIGLDIGREVEKGIDGKRIMVVFLRFPGREHVSFICTSLLGGRSLKNSCVNF